MRQKLPILRDLFLTFLKIGLFTFGGGYAMLALITDACVERKKWLTANEMMDVTVIAESTPGPIAINCATYAGSKMAGMPGAIAATLGMVLPSFVILLAISLFFDRFLEIGWIARAFRGIKVGVGLLIVQAGAGMLRKMPAKPQPRVIAACALAAMLAISFFSLRISSITLMLVCGAVSALLYACSQKGGCAK